MAEDNKLDLSSSRAAKEHHNKIVDFTRKEYQKIRSARIRTERQWYINLAFYYGKQNVVATAPEKAGLGTKLWVPPAPYYRVRPVFNRIRPTIRHELAQLTNNKPSASIVPSSAEDRDMYAAMAGEQIWENIYDEKKLKSIIRRAIWWSLVCGSGFIKNYLLPDDDIKYCAETPFNILAPDFREEEIEEQPFIIHAQIRSAEWIQMKFGNLINNQGTDSDKAETLIEDSFLNLIGASNLERSKSLLVFEVWVKPGAHPLFPNGAMYTMVGDQIVQGQEGLPYSHGQYPFAKIDHIPGGKFYGTSSIEDLIPLQKEYNRTRGQIIEAKNRMAKPQLSAPRGAVDASKITTEPGLLVEYVPGMEAPKPIPLQPLPAYVIQELDRTIQDWNEISGQHEVSKGEVPPGVTAATAISFLQERDETKMSPTFDSVEEGIEKTARQTLVLVRDYWNTEKLIRITGPDGSFDVMAFKGSDLRENVDIRVEAGSSLPVSKAARQALIMDLMKMGFIEPQQGLEVMDMGGLNKIYERLQTDRRQAQRENLRMSRVTEVEMGEWQQGAEQHEMIQQLEYEQQLQQAPPVELGGMPEPFMPEPYPLIVPVNTWDNHQVHIQYHNEFRKGQAFENLPIEAKQLFEEHVQQHVAAMGIEQYSQNPNIVSGLPPLPQQPEEQQGQQQSNQEQPFQNPIDQAIAQGGGVEGQSNTGPQPMPELSGGGF